MADPAPDSVSELTEDTAHDDGDSPPTVPASNGITHSESTTANEVNWTCNTRNLSRKWLFLHRDFVPMNNFQSH